MVEWMNQSSVRPAWETISRASPTSKKYWTQWDALRLKDDMLERQCVTTDVLNRYWQTKDQSSKLQSPWKGPYSVLKRLSDVTYRIKERRKAQPKVVLVNRLWQYHGPGQYTWEVSEELLPTTDEDQTGDPGRTQDPGNPTMDK
ncbi:hypothetical protein Hamer_G002442 [Homarus americanus]|uniref:Integrase p58-like C-terminal domain-containing protein n=1 Tax=Homarus americanus TaxID=6706 RepID=A0A8J5K664_HOMAM|nr:hypothetical protein Hamer_G002442 [Homarus americanus]